MGAVTGRTAGQPDAAGDEHREKGHDGVDTRAAWPLRNCIAVH
jgi:hypothetical protein